MSGYMLDTMIAGEFIRGGSAAVDEKLLRVPSSKVNISSISEAEIRYELAKKPQAVKLHRAAEAFLRTVEIQSFDSPAAATYASLRAAYEKAGLSIGNLDALIAAHAHSLGMRLVTRDKALHRLGPWLKVEQW